MTIPIYSDTIYDMVSGQEMPQAICAR
jgi:hypothetical protein